LRLDKQRIELIRLISKSSQGTILRVAVISVLVLPRKDIYIYIYKMWFGTTLVMNK